MVCGGEGGGGRPCLAPLNGWEGGGEPLLGIIDSVFWYSFRGSYLTRGHILDR